MSAPEQAFVAAYIEGSYSVVKAAEISGMAPAFCRKAAGNPNVRRAVYEVQAELDSIDFLNEKWVKAQVVRLLPMLLGDEPVPMIDNMGDQYEARKFFPEASIGLLKMVNEMTKSGNVGADGTPAPVGVTIVVEDAGRDSPDQGE